MTKPYDIIPRFTPIITQCPQEDGCDGLLEISAYLEVTGSFYTIPPTSNDPKKYNVKGNILPQKVVIPFALETIVTESHEAAIPTITRKLTICDGFTTGIGVFARSHPKTISENLPDTTTVVERYYNRDTLPTSTIVETGDCISGTATFMWSTNLFPITGAAQTSITGTPLPILGELATILQTGAIINFGGSNYPLEVGWEICYSNGRCVLKVVPMNHPNFVSEHALPSAKGIFDGTSTQLPIVTEA